MNKNKARDIHDRIYNFVIRVLKLLKQLPKTPESLVIINQITRSATSMGANDREADGTTTKRGKRNRLLAKYNCRYKRILETKNEKSDTRRSRNN